ncbi:excinuclease ABC subunit UvrC [Solirubrobacter sp. CPCC 204708]|uniref:UvrABC system protein C n=1 Tax=Solirubrobacter deserti TaxID=2282478 RepID=A0ABT4RUW6_9ACTN|nr:excinuclease ABC subunit UvrC [Solirubrobacter deserti]MBE2320001.1 excinuclease ABC subunit UvrC [Solirubrobacter deserti]MDA0142361.1 excinuclease ABC subunit UvrC [Solirubrobacter deserti]
MAVQTESERLREQRLSLPDQPGVYVFRDQRGKVIYVGKAKSIRKRVASHFSNPTMYGTTALTSEIADIQPLVVVTESEALLTEQNFIKQYKPKFNIRLRDDKSYPYIAISLDEDFPRVYFTREKHKSKRAYFGPYSSAKRVRNTLDLLGKIFLFRSCEGPEPGRHSGSPCLDYYIKRCGAPCVGYVSKEEYREGIDGVVAFLSGRFKQIERDLEKKMYFAAGEQDYEQATIERNRLQAVKALLERQRVAEGGAGTYDAVAVAVEGTEANAQVFQVRDGVLSDRQSFYLDNQAEQDPAIVTEEFMLQFYASALSIPSLIVVPGFMAEGSELGVLGQLLGERRGSNVEIRASERGGKRRILDLAERNAKLALDQEKLKAERKRQQRVDSLNGLQSALDLSAIPVRIECFDISHVGGTHTVASMVVFEGGAPKKSDYRRFTIRSHDGNDDFASMNEVLGRRYAQWEKQNEKSPYDADRDASFAALPNLVVIDGGKGQLSAGLPPLQGFRDRGVAVVSLAKRIEEVFLPGVPNPVLMAHETPELQLLQRIRDEAHRFAITHHRIRRDKAMTESIMDELPGIGPARKRALLKHFGSPEAVLGASREDLEQVPGFPQKVARDLYAHLNKTGR